ncbi:MAG: EAL domain-containing protein [Lachnospiraceae bacterium]|nr:EAL domain-containing protein [Lachnospiraceae bacterium]
MASRKRIALLMGQADEYYQLRFIRGFVQEAFDRDTDVCIFSMLIKYQNTPARETGDSNIFSLVNYSLFDAVVLLSDTIQTPGVLEALEEKIKKSFQGPVLVVDQKSRNFPSIWTDSYTPVRKLIAHLIEKHGYKDIAYLTGKKWHPHSQSRLQAYRDEMAAHGLTVREDRIFYGDYWYSSGSACAEHLLRNREDMPEAIAFANDQMAVGFCQAMEENGIHIPGDIAVAGFDSVEEGRTSPVPITSAYIPACSTGRHAAKSIFLLMEGKEIRDPETEVELFMGGSCGCDAKGVSTRSILRDGWATVLSEGSFFSLHNRMPEDLMLQTSLRNSLDVMYEYRHQIKGYESFHIFLTEQWATPASLNRGRLSSHGYTERMIHAMALYGEEGRKDRLSINTRFDTALLMPELSEERGEPRAFIFSPLHFEDSCFGYAVINYGREARSYDETYRLWLQSAVRGLEALRRYELADMRRGGVVFEKNEQQALPEEERVILEEVESILNENRLSYFYQPIVNAEDGSIYAFEALMRARSEMKVSPLQIIKYATMMNRLGDVEKATFLNVLSQVEGSEESFEGRHIFINSIPGVKLSEEDHARIEEMLTRRGEQAVVELTEQTEMDDRELGEMKARFARMGIGSALDDYGTGYSNVSNLLRYMPDYVKVDRSLLSGIQDSPQKQHFVREIVTFSHDNGIKVLAEGVETGEELRCVIGLNVDLIQGYYTGRPGPEVIEGIDEKIAEEIRTWQKDRIDGSFYRTFETGKADRFSTASLIRDGYTILESRGGAVTYNDYILSGTPGQSTELQLRISAGYEGQITFENVNLGSTRNNPCIILEPGTKLTLVLQGENNLKRGGILVPEGASLTLRGDGDLRIQLNQDDYCGIGNLSGRSGTIEFAQDGSVMIDCNGNRGIGIGGKDGTDIRISRGRYVLQHSGEKGVGMGSLDGNVEMSIHDCELDLSFSCDEACGIGSLNGDADLSIRNVFLRCFFMGRNFTGFGSLKGSRAKVQLKDLGCNMDIRAEKGCGAGSFGGHSEVRIEGVDLHFTGSGAALYAYGGKEGLGSFFAENANLVVRLRNEEGRETLLEQDNMNYANCRADYTLNGISWDVIS